MKTDTSFAEDILMCDELCAENSHRQKLCQSKIDSYQRLCGILPPLLEKPRHRILAPIAGGLAYVKAELIDTNRLLVLLGDGWFAERSISQATEIINTRILYLQEEFRTLSTEGANFKEKYQMLTTGQSITSLPTTVCTNDSLDSTSGLKPTSSMKTEPPEREVNPFDNLADIQFTPEDELTMDELIEIERQLGNLIEDDALVEKTLTEWMIRKHNLRLQKENSVNPLLLSTPSSSISSQKNSTHPPSSKHVHFDSSIPDDSYTSFENSLPKVSSTLLTSSKNNSVIMRESVEERINPSNKEPFLMHNSTEQLPLSQKSYGNRTKRKPSLFAKLNNLQA